MSERYIAAGGDALWAQVAQLQEQSAVFARQARQQTAVARNLAVENAFYSVCALQKARHSKAIHEAFEAEIDDATMQATFFSAGAPKRVCGALLAAYIPPWVLWHMPEDRVRQLACACESLIASVPPQNSAQRTRIVHEFTAMIIDRYDMNAHKPTSGLTHAERTQMERFKAKLRNSHKELASRARCAANEDVK